MSLDHSTNIEIPTFENIPRNVPYDVFYQTLTSSGYDEQGFEFNITTPGDHALLTKDIWIEYKIRVRETANRTIQRHFEDYATSVNIYSNNKFSFRQGNVMARSIRQMNVTINQNDMKYYPADYFDVLSRLYVSQTQSKHEFSASGGSFDSGNHGFRTNQIIYSELNPNANMVPDDWKIENQQQIVNANTKLFVHVIQGWHEDGDVVDDDIDLICNARNAYPILYPFYNPGFSDRVATMSLKLRHDANDESEANWPLNSQFQPVLVAGTLNNYYWTFTILERLPIPLFKMYSTDGIKGCIPNIKEMNIRALFHHVLFNSMFNYSEANLNASLYWTGITLRDCKLYVKWILPKMQIPEAISIKCPRIDTKVLPYLQSDTLTNLFNATHTLKYADTDINFRDISLIAVPDVLLVYARIRSNKITLHTPNDCHMELLNLYIHLGASAGKLTGISSVMCYQLWKNSLKHHDNDIMGYDEWRKYCFVAVLKPEDYGLKNYDDINKPVYLQINCTARNWWINPSVLNGNIEILSDDNNNREYELVITSIYFRNEMILSKDRSYHKLQSMIDEF